MPFELVPDGTHIDFLKYRKICLGLSLTLIAIGLGFALTKGVPVGIDFAGGTEIQIEFNEGVTTNESAIRDVAKAAGFDDATVVRFGEVGTNEYLVKYKDVATEVDSATAEQGDGLVSNTRVIDLERAIRAQIGDFTEQRVEYVGPKVGEELREDGLNALLLSAIAILIYVAFRFSSRYAPGAVVAVVHDLAITSGLLIIAGVEFDLRILAALLAILGYSLNDTIIIYDRIRENMELHTTVDLEETLNLSVNQTLSRTVLTSITTILALFSLYFLGGEVIRPFAFAMLIGVLVGTYSSIFIASPMLLFLETRYGDSPEERKKKAKKKKAAARA